MRCNAPSTIQSARVGTNDIEETMSIGKDEWIADLIKVHCTYNFQHIINKNLKLKRNFFVY
jgi:hypothetical protein